MSTASLPEAGAMASAPALERELARLIVETLRLEDRPEDISPDDPLFGEGLGLDSIDALELALAISRTYGFELKSDAQRNTQIFASLRSLAAHIDAHRTR
jgi:acyl carrier protein